VGGAFWKTNAYAPWPVWIWLNGHVRHEVACVEWDLSKEDRLMSVT
jgi:hypothetical protein